jgi:hypothetical protein
MCGGMQPPGTSCHRVVTRYRRVKYRYRKDANFVVRWINGKRKEKKVDDPGGVGWEAVGERIACAACAAGHVPKRE